MAAELPSLCVPPSGRLYGRRQLDALRADLAASSRSTLVLELVEPAQLRLGPDGRTAEGHRLTQDGLRHACNAMAAGLHAYLADLSGRDRRPDDPPGSYSLDEAIRVFNRTLDRRFGCRLAGRHSLVLDVARGTIDGLVGPRFEFLGHDRFLEIALESAAGEGRNFVFREAAFGGRRLSVRMIERGRLAVDRDGAPWYGGMLFANSEIGGEQPAAGSPLVVQPAAGLYAVGPGRAGRTIHSGRDMEGRLAASLGLVAAARQDPAAIAAAFAWMAARRLGVPDRGEGRSAAVAKWAARLVRRGMPGRLAARAVHAATASGDAPMSTEVHASGQDGSFSVFDLYKSVSALAQSRGQAEREALERVAWTLLTQPAS